VLPKLNGSLRSQRIVERLLDVAVDTIGLFLYPDLVSFLLLLENVPPKT